MLAGARSARHGRTAERAAFKSHIDFDRRITARIKNFARLVAIGLVIGCCAVIGAEPARLPADQLARAIKNDSISIPTPGELFAALEKPGKPNWSGQYRAPMPMTYR